jgi:hypothetical protein
VESLKMVGYESRALGGLSAPKARLTSLRTGTEFLNDFGLELGVQPEGIRIIV